MKITKTRTEIVVEKTKLTRGKEISKTSYTGPTDCTKNTKTAAKEKPVVSLSDKSSGMLDMVIAFDTTGSMSSYLNAIRKEVVTLIPQLFEENENLRLGIVAFGDYCDMLTHEVFGAAYQCIQPTNDLNSLIKFVKIAKETYGGDGDEFYELVIRKIVDETPWRMGSKRSVLLIADADPHEIGYSYNPYITHNTIDWRKEAYKAAKKGIKFDTVAINNQKWMKELSLITGGVRSPFKTGSKTGHLIRASVLSRGSASARAKFDKLKAASLMDAELRGVYKAYDGERYMS